jgi:tetratricopeptide (TPR) repeat protein/CHAT domain-containing protein
MHRVKRQPSRLHNGAVVSAALLLFCTLFAPHTSGQTLGSKAGQPGSDDTEAQLLVPGQRVERELKGGESHFYVINLRRGEFLRALVEQRGVDVVVTLTSRADTLLFEVNLVGETGPEPISYEATEDGDYFLEVWPFNATAHAGRYGIVASLKSGATADDRARMAAERLLVESEKLIWLGGTDNLRRSIEKITQSLSTWRGLDDKYWVAYALNVIGITYDKLDDRQKALVSYQEALSLRKGIGDHTGEADTLQNIGYLHNKTGRKQEAADFFKQAAAARRAAGEHLQEALMINQAGLMYTELGEDRKALDFYNEALPLFKEMGERLIEGHVLFNLGFTYWRLKDREKALDYYNQALALYEANGGGSNQANTLIIVGDIYWETGEKKKAVEYYDQAVTKSRAAGDYKLEARALGKLGNVDYQLGDRQKALDYYNQALTLLQGKKDRAGQASSLSYIGFIYNEQGEWQKAVGYYEQALKLYKEDGDARGEMDTLKSLGNIVYTRDKKRVIGYDLQLSRLQHAAKAFKDEAETLRSIGFLYEDLRQWENALGFLDRTLAIYRANGDRGGEADTLCNIGNVFNLRDKMPEALKKYEQALTIYDSLKPGWAKGNALNNIGLIYYQTGDKPKALEYYERALPLFHDAGDKRGEANALINTGLIYAERGEQWKALEYYQQSLSLRRQLDDARGVADALMNIGITYRAIGDDEKALDSFEQALKLRRSSGDKYGEANALSRLGETYLAVGEIDKAAEDYQQALPLFISTADRDDETEVLISLIILKLGLGETQEALTYIKQIQAIAHADKDRAFEAFLRIFSGGAYLQLKDQRAASAEFEQSIRVLKAEHSPIDQAVAFLLVGLMYATADDNEKALEYFNQGLSSLSPSDDPKLKADIYKIIGVLHATMNEKTEAQDALSQSLTFYRAARNRSGEASVLVIIGNIYEEQGEKEKAAQYYTRAVSLRLEPGKVADAPVPLEAKAGTYDSLGERKEHQELLKGDQGALFELYLKNYQNAKDSGQVGPQAEALSRMMGTIMEQAPYLAIILGKQAVEKYQEVRSNPGLYNMRLAENTYMRSFPSTCRDLADLLIEKGRLYEAEQVLSMLKEDEYADYVRRDGAEAAALSRRVDLRPEERKLFAEYARNFDNLTAMGGRIAALKEKQKDGASLSNAEREEFEKLNNELSDANRAFNLFLGRIETELNGSGRDVVRELKESGRKSDVERWGAGTVELDTFVLPNRYRVILTTPYSRVDRKYDISAADLNRKIMTFRRTLMDPSVDPRPQARELYDILIKPVEKDLEGANAKTLIWELDGALRYLPLPALYDGKQYMVERYQQAVITLASSTRLSERFRGEWRGLGLGVSAQWGTLPALPAVVGELESIIHDESPPCAPSPTKVGVVGVLPGRCLLDKDFTAQSFADALGRNFNFIHIASHFSFSPGGAERSFLLLGDGNRLTLQTIDADAAKYDLNGVELLTLSACNTAIEGGDAGAEASGSEVESFGVIAQRRGAKAVIATLWEVGDDSTRALMREFYRILGTTPGIAKAEALRRAQLALLNGDVQAKAADVSKPRADLVGLGRLKSTENSFQYDSKRPYAHPYYWAPFLLIGNWQ